MTFRLSSNLNSAPGFLLNCWIPFLDPHDTSLSTWDWVEITAFYPLDHGRLCTPHSLTDAIAILMQYKILMVCTKKIQSATLWIRCDLAPWRLYACSHCVMWMLCNVDGELMLTNLSDESRMFLKSKILTLFLHNMAQTWLTTKSKGQTQPVFLKPLY